MSILKDEKKCSEFIDKLLADREQKGKIDSWNDFAGLITKTSNEFLVKEKEQLTPRRLTALSEWLRKGKIWLVKMKFN